MILHHFTSLQHLPFILKDGLLKPTESNIGSPNPQWSPAGLAIGPDVVWFLDEEEPTFGHGLNGSIVDKGNVRITVEVGYPVKWTDWQWTAKMHPAWKHHLLEAAGGPEAAEHWYVIPAPVRKARWRSITNVRLGEPILFE
jgi:hypothetical protein